MTPQQRIKRHILLEAIACNDDLKYDGEITSDNVDAVWYEVIVVNDADSDLLGDFRNSGECTNLPTQCSRHYEAEEVARQLNDGRWVGWTHWYGGGKHGDPGSIEWLSGAYDVVVTEEMRPVRSFTKC